MVIINYNCITMNETNKQLDPRVKFGRNALNWYDEETLLVLPTIFDNDKEITKKLEYHYDMYNRMTGATIKDKIVDDKGFTQIKRGANIFLKPLSASAKDLALEIADKLKWNSNAYYVHVDYLCMYLGVSARTLDDLIKELIKNRIVARTNRCNLLCVNHNIFFNGIETEFIKKYNELYPEYITEQDGKGRIKVISRNKLTYLKDNSVE